MGSGTEGAPEEADSLVQSVGGAAKSKKKKKPPSAFTPLWMERKGKGT